MAGDQVTLRLSFPSLTPRERDVAAQRLAAWLQERSSATSVHRERTSHDAQDFGATLVLVLGTPAVIAVANAIRDYVTRDHVDIEVSKPDGASLHIAGGKSADSAASLAAFMSAKS